MVTKQLWNVVVAGAFAIVMGPFALAQGNSTSDETGDSSVYPYPYYDMHNHNRAIAFGSLLIQGAGSDIDQWKQVRAFEGCWFNATSETGLGLGDPVPDPIPLPTCQWEVLITTAYNFVECPDGRTYIERSGEGVWLESRHVGENFAWAEMALCMEDPFFQTAAAGEEPPLDRRYIRYIVK